MYDTKTPTKSRTTRKTSRTRPGGAPRDYTHTNGQNSSADAERSTRIAFLVFMGLLGVSLLYFLGMLLTL